MVNSLVNAVRSCLWLSLFGRIGVGSANIGPPGRIHSFTAISHYLTSPSTHKLPVIVTTSYHSCVNRVRSHHVYWEPKTQTENSHHVYWEPKTQTENSRCSHTWHHGDARETITRLEANFHKVEDEASRSDTTLTSAQQLLEHINKAMQDFRKCHHRGYCWWCRTSRTSWMNRKIRQLSYHPAHTDPLQTIRWWLIHW